MADSEQANERYEVTWLEDAASGRALGQVDALVNGDSDVMQFLLEGSGDVNAVVKNGKTILMLAAEAGEWEFVPFLVEAGADVDATDENGTTALMHASQNGALEGMRCLVENHANVNAADRCGETALMRAAKSGVLEAVQFLVENKADVAAMDAHGSPALILAAASSKWDVVQFLVENGADAKTSDSDGRAVLMYAAERSAWDVVRFLVDHGADVNAFTTSTRRTVLMYASEKGELEITRFLLEAGADADLTDHQGHQAIFFAHANRHHAVRRLLLRHIQLTQDVDGPIQGSWYISPFDIELVSFVDTKNIGGEYQAKWLDADVVIKLFVAGAAAATFESEVTVWHQMRHPNVIKLYGACDSIHHFFVCEYASNGSLGEYLAECGRRGMQRTPWKFLHEAALGLAYLHERKIVHRNLRGSSILIGNDGLAKLADFELSGTAMPPATQGRTGGFESVRWQAPELLRGENASLASDVYSLGLCIVEAVTGTTPWRNLLNRRLNAVKCGWDPVRNENDWRAPARLTDENVRSLTTRLCCRDPSQRISASSVVHILERMAPMEQASLQQYQPEPEPSVQMDEYKNGKLVRSWSRLQDLAQQGGELQLEIFRELEGIYERLGQGEQPRRILHRFGELLDECIGSFQAGSAMNRILRLSSTRATEASMSAILHRVDAMWAMIDPSHAPDEARRLRREELRSSQLDVFVLEVQRTLLVLHDLGTREDRVTFLNFLRVEIDAHSDAYTSSQLEIMAKAFEDLIRDGESNVLMTTPVWFLPWYELVVDPLTFVGEGGFAKVYLAKWLDSDVVVKQVRSLWSTKSEGSSWSFSSISSSIPATRSSSIGSTERLKADAMFKREVNIWFSLNHPHVVRLFGACHVGTQIFACEYASNGTLVSYLRKHPNELWQKLHEAALGVQYLHAVGVVHGDLKGNNIVVGSDGKAKVTDFGLSSSTDEPEDDDLVSGAYQWMAPECFELGVSGRSRASDVYSLGMCIVEALRVVEGAEFYLPWGDLDNAAVKHHARMGSLPLSPAICTDDQWELVKKMCAYEPKKRIKIGTVVDELKKLTGENENRSTATATAPGSVADVIATMKTIPFLHASSAVCHIYGLLWDRLEHVSALLVNQAFLELVASAEATTPSLEIPDALIKFTEMAIRGYALHRRLDKLMEANFLSFDGDEGKVHDWKSLCEDFMRGIDTGRQAER